MPCSTHDYLGAKCRVVVSDDGVRYELSIFASATFFTVTLHLPCRCFGFFFLSCRSSALYCTHPHTTAARHGVSRKNRIEHYFNKQDCFISSPTQTLCHRTIKKKQQTVFFLRVMALSPGIAGVA